VRVHRLSSSRDEGRQAAIHLDAAGDLFSEPGPRLCLDQLLEKRDTLKA
jgi:hypothetical protein